MVARFYRKPTVMVCFFLNCVLISCNGSSAGVLPSCSGCGSRRIVAWVQVLVLHFGFWCFGVMVLALGES